MNLRQKKDNITINDIAKKLNISASTVSRALNNHERISIETREKVWKLARKMGYKSNLSVYMEPENSKTICLVVPDIRNNIISDIIESIQNYALHENFNLLLAYSQNSARIEKTIIDNLSKLNIQGIIIFASDETDKSLHPNVLKDLKIPYVLINNFQQDFSASNVIPDIYQGLYLAMQHLDSMNCKNTALITCEKDYSKSTIQKAYKAIAENLNMQTLDLITDVSLINSDKIVSVIKDLQQKGDSPIGIITGNNMLAYHLLYQLRIEGISVPNDVLVISFGSDQFETFITPTLTSVQYSGIKIGKSAAKLLFDEIKSGKNLHETIIEPVKLTIKGSSLRVNMK